MWLLFVLFGSRLIWQLNSVYTFNLWISGLPQLAWKQRWRLSYARSSRRYLFLSVYYGYFSYRLALRLCLNGGVKPRPKPIRTIGKTKTQTYRTCWLATNRLSLFKVCFFIVGNISCRLKLIITLFVEDREIFKCFLNVWGIYGYEYGPITSLVSSNPP